MAERKTRRVVMAELLLLASPLEMRQTSNSSLAVEFAAITELRAWLEVAGLNTPDLLTNEHDGVRDDGRPYRTLYVWPTWHGWNITAIATDWVDPASLDGETRDRLTALVVG